MNVASLDLCKELYELSGWRDTEYSYYGRDEKYASVLNEDGYEISHRHSMSATPEIAPAYSLGYLLRKLPKTVDGYFLSLFPRYKWYAEYSATFGAHEYSKLFQGVADTPENAVCKLAIELFKQGILKDQRQKNE